MSKNSIAVRTPGDLEVRIGLRIAPVDHSARPIGFSTDYCENAAKYAHVICRVDETRGVQFSGEIAKLNADRIVLAWNCHDDLLAALKALSALAIGCIENISDDEHAVVDAARAAIVRAEGAATATADHKQNIHEWFELTYAQFLVVPRVIMSGMPEDWQEKMAELLDQMGATFDYSPGSGDTYYVRVGKAPEWPYEDKDGNPIEPVLSAPSHELCNYRRPRIEHRRKAEAAQ